MTAVVITYILAEPNIALGKFIPFAVVYVIGGVFALLQFGFHLFVTFAPERWRMWMPHPVDNEEKE